jgi:ATP-GRASP peptide maturase of grasp-with-spasm system
MILMIYEDGDFSSFIVADWLEYHNKDCILVNDKKTDVCIKKISLNNNSNEIEVEIDKQLIINLNDITSYYWRRGMLEEKINSKEITTKNNNKEIEKTFNYHFVDNNRKNLEFLYYYLESKHSVGGRCNLDINKMYALDCAKKSGLKVPDTLITDSKNELVNFFNKNNRVISKPITNNISFIEEKVAFANVTVEVSKKDINDLGDLFYPTLFQEYIEKKYEIRVFVLKDKCYSMAIFSQLDEQTKIDFRNYNIKKLNRSVPFQLPKLIEDNIISFMQKINLDTGSIDLIMSNNNEFVFLEVNPVGQFGMVSVPCNYYIEKRIAEYLMNNG